MAKPSPNAATVEALQKENARLEAENARLSKLAARHQPAEQSRQTSQRWRPYAVTVLMILAVILLVLGNLFFWAGNTVVKQDRFVATTTPVIQNSQVQQAMSLYATNQIFSTVDVTQVVEQALPPRADFLAPQLAGQLKTGTRTAFQTILARPQFQTRWNAVLAKQHDRIIQYAKTYQGNGTISLNDIFQQLAANLQNTRLSFLAGKQLPPQVGNITVITATWLPVLHTVISNIDIWRSLSILGLIIFLALAIWISHNRRRTVYLFCLFSALGLAISLILLRAIRERIIDTVDPQYVGGVTQAIQILVHGLVVQTFTIIAALLVFGLITWVSGSSHSAMATKQQTQALFTGRLHALMFREENTVSRWVGGHRRLLEWGAVVIFIISMLSVRLTATTLIVGVLLLLIAVLIVEALSPQVRGATDHT